LIRPVCPFIEIWARLGEQGTDPSTWRDAPVTPSLLATAGIDPSALRFTIDARNAKASRRRRNPDLSTERSRSWLSAATITSRWRCTRSVRPASHSL
jgi:hypothetical protein